MEGLSTEEGNAERSVFCCFPTGAGLGTLVPTAPSAKGSSYRSPLMTQNTPEDSRLNWFYSQCPSGEMTLGCLLIPVNRNF